MTAAQAQPNLQQLAARFQQAAQLLDRNFLDKQEIIRLLIISRRSPASTWSSSARRARPSPR